MSGGFCKSGTDLAVHEHSTPLRVGVVEEGASGRGLVPRLSAKHGPSSLNRQSVATIETHGTAPNAVVYGGQTREYDLDGGRRVPSGHFVHAGNGRQVDTTNEAVKGVEPVGSIEATAGTLLSVR